MRKLIFVHGINNESYTPAEIQKEWSEALKSQLIGEGKKWWDNVEIRTAYYANVLHSEEQSWKQDIEVTTRMSVDSPASDYADDAIASMYLELQNAYNLDNETVAAELDYEDEIAAVSRMAAGIHKKWLKAIARALEKVIPSAGNGLARTFLSQAAAYLNKPGVFESINELVNDQVFHNLQSNEKTVVVSHSLGTIISYVLLRRLQTSDKIPLFVTLGSPLGIKIVKDRINGPYIRPPSVSKWINGSDPEDFVALHPTLNEETFGPANIINIESIENGYEDAHSISRYLQEERIAREIEQVLN